jgi:hypothetical protein
MHSIAAHRGSHPRLSRRWPVHEGPQSNPLSDGHRDARPPLSPRHRIFAPGAAFHAISRVRWMTNTSDVIGNSFRKHRSARQPAPPPRRVRLMPLWPSRPAVSALSARREPTSRCLRQLRAASRIRWVAPLSSRPRSARSPTAAPAVLDSINQCMPAVIINWVGCNPVHDP